MSKRSVTMKSLMDENTLLKMKVVKLEKELAFYTGRGFWLRLFDVFRFRWGGQ